VKLFTMGPEYSAKVQSNYEFEKMSAWLHFTRNRAAWVPQAGASRHFTALRNLVAIGGIADSGKLTAGQICGFTA
jgi:hypothetical protein